MNNRSAFSFLNSQQSKTRPVASKITIKQFYLPGGSSTQVRGVPSDIALPSVNEFLPIGEDDLPHALPWGKIDKIDWVNDWNKLDVDSPEDPALIARLAESSEARRSALEEFRFLKEQIEWRRQRFEEKEVSIHLEKRIQRKITEQAYIDELDDAYEALSEEDYAMKSFILKVTEEQEAQSKKNLAQSAGDEAAREVAVEEDEEPAFDIYLRESARIMADWIEMLKMPERATAAVK